MANIRAKLQEIYSLEQLASGGSVIHRLHPNAKLFATLVYIVCVVSFGRYELSRLAPYAFYPVLLMVLAEIPFQMILKRALVALPFVLFAGLSNLVFDRAAVMRLGGVAISYGMVSFLAMLLRTFLCVAAVLILVAVTPFYEMTGALKRLHMPDLIVNLIEMIYRYLGTLAEEASGMYTAYALRSPNGRGVAMKHMGSFAGQLLLRSFDRAERVYNAMQCRGYPAFGRAAFKKRFTAADGLFLFLTAGSSVLFSLMDVQGALGAWLEGIF
ncbi:MAG TPA: cobalt ECF transporter T component CbiQ [Clostridia bacterium]|nr:cobalt ECF transporter T component CbiQ [Clostridia bacterium]